MYTFIRVQIDMFYTYIHMHTFIQIQLYVYTCIHACTHIDMDSKPVLDVEVVEHVHLRMHGRICHGFA
jgi:hypothetical protein